MRPKTLWLSLLPTLDAVLNARTITEAAEKAHLTQPALSIALRKARAHFNDDLVIYRGGRSELTELGAALRPRVRAALDAARDALGLELQFDPGTSTRTVRIAANSHIEFVFISPLLARIYADAPLVSVTVQRFGQLPPKPSAVEDVDIMFASQFFDATEYSSVKLFSDRFTCLVWKDHPTIGAALTMEQYLSVRHATTITANERSPALLRRLEASHKVALYAPSAAALPYMIVGTDLVITGMSRYCEPFTRHLPLRLVRLIGDKETAKDLNINVAVLWKPHRNGEPFIQWLIDTCQRVARDLQ